MSIHKTAMISNKAEIHPTVEIGSNVTIEDGVVLSQGVKVKANAYICSGTSIGENTIIHMGAVIGHEPQDHAYKGEKTFTRIGKNNVIREFVTIHRGTAEGSSTIVGDDNMFMVSSHLGHNTRVGNKVIIANGALLAGHVVVDNGAFLSGNVVFHQFCHIGEYAMIGGFTGVNKDVPPYMLVRGPSAIRGINLVGMRRSGMPRESIGEIKEAYKLLFLSELTQEAAIARMKEELRSQEAGKLVAFIENSKRGICVYRYEKEEYF
ncbi:MAG: acyl-ACP--UDP-N-acetylglucosamine O-acyltransferase [Candidatus Omnitrophica bacterium]|nr:acyl-ACP--UDP-N-acetylglucosamine O-acyltransferase [Candidatus Omnitrophota bacterium]